MKEMKGITLSFPVGFFSPQALAGSFPAKA
jgi:hypothetical protein